MVAAVLKPKRSLPLPSYHFKMATAYGDPKPPMQEELDKLTRESEKLRFSVQLAYDTYLVGGDVKLDDVNKQFRRLTTLQMEMAAARNALGLPIINSRDQKRHHQLAVQVGKMQANQSDDDEVSEWEESSLRSYGSDAGWTTDSDDEQSTTCSDASPSTDSDEEQPTADSDAGWTEDSADLDDEQPTPCSDAGWTEDSADHDVEGVVETNDDYEESSSFWSEESEVYDESEDPWTRDQEQQETIVKESYEDEQSTNCPDASPTADSDDVQTDPDAGWTMDSNDEPTSPQSKDSWNKSLLKLDEDYYEDDDCDEDEDQALLDKSRSWEIAQRARRRDSQQA